MIGPKKLSAIRHELRQALAETGDDPIHWLEERIAVSEHQGAAASDESEVLHSLRRILETTEHARRRKPRAGTKK